MPQSFVQNLKTSLFLWQTTDAICKLSIVNMVTIWETFYMNIRGGGGCNVSTHGQFFDMWLLYSYIAV
jgi:hypothetical protein